MLAGALINYADDDGYFNANPALIKAECFPLREPSVSIQVGLMELSRIDYLELGEHSGRIYGHIKNFLEHQRVNHPTPSKIKSLQINWGGLTEDSLNTPVSLRPEGKGKEGKGRERKKEAGSVSKNETAPSRRPLILFNESTRKLEGIPESFLQKLKEAYPAVDIGQQIAEAETWLLANPANRKSNYYAFLQRWMSKEQDRAPRINGSPQGKHEVGHTEYTDIAAYRKAKERGDKNISLHWSLRQKYPGE